jgi:hypothetical protein
MARKRFMVTLPKELHAATKRIARGQDPSLDVSALITPCIKYGIITIKLGGLEALLAAIKAQEAVLEKETRQHKADV